MAEIQHRTKKDYALVLIRELILRGELDPGSHVHQTELATRLKISLTPVREALRQLESEGLVASIAHRGVRVRTTDQETLRNIYIGRRLIEPYVAARGVARLVAPDYRAAADLLKRLDRAHARRDASTVRKANYDFHFLLYERADVPVLLDMVRKLWGQFPWDVLTEVPDRMRSSKIEHREILAAMEKGDAAMAEEACARHLLQSYLDISSYLDGEQAGVDPFVFPGH